MYCLCSELNDAEEHRLGDEIVDPEEMHELREVRVVKLSGILLRKPCEDDLIVCVRTAVERAVDRE